MAFSPSRIIAGVMNWGSWGAQLNTNSIIDLISGCLDLGVNTFDHADIYGGHTTEVEFGKAFKQSGIDRKEIILMTKCGIAMPSGKRPDIKAKHYDTSQQYIRSSVEQSLQNLNTDYIDLLMLHRPSPLMDPRVVAETIGKLKNEGKILHFGVSNFSSTQIALISQHTPVICNQIEISPLQINSFIDGALDQCMNDKIIPMAWSPLGGGKLFDKVTDIRTLSLRSRLMKVANKYGWSLDYMIYLFLLHHPSNIIPVTGSSKLSRIETAFAASKEEIKDAQWFEIYTACLGHNVP